jgi:hypothetical protein
MEASDPTSRTTTMGKPVAANSSGAGPQHRQGAPPRCVRPRLADEVIE